MTNRSPRAPLSATLLALLITAAGCSTVDLKSHAPVSAEEALTVAAGEREVEGAQRYLLRVASQFQDQGRHDAARAILTSEQLKTPIPDLRDQATLQSLTSAVALGDAGWASQLADLLTVDQFRNYKPDVLPRAADLQAETFRLAGQPVKAAQTLILAREVDPRSDVQQIHDRIWQNLKDASDQQLEKAARDAIGFEDQGWLELAGVMRQPAASLEARGKALRSWQTHWPGHPAAEMLPSELTLIVNIASNRPEQISIALPLSGPLAAAGQAIRDGFLAAFYTDDAAREYDIEIQVTDTNGKAFAELYQNLASQSPDLIIGPLEKEAVTELAGVPTLSVPVLALNYLPEGLPAPDQLYQFGLSAEDEVRQIASHLAEKGANQVLALIPAGEWGDRVERALNQQLANDGGRALDIERFYPEDNFRAVTAEMLGINSSRERAIAVEQTIALNLEFEARRRQDVDAIILVAPPTMARQFKPLFAFYFAGDVPVYSPSVIYEGSPAPSRDRDLESIQLTDLPWVLAEENSFRQQASAAFNGYRGQLGRLFAMGADAYHLTTRLPLLRNIPGATVSGQTGTLSMWQDGSIHRQQLWARFQGGRPALLKEANKAPEASGETSY